MSFGGDGNKRYIGTSPSILGWGMAAAFGVKLARPDLPVISVVGDGSFCFSGPQPLWSQSRYKAPVMNIVLNNHSYNNERNRIWHYDGRQYPDRPRHDLLSRQPRHRLRQVGGGLRRRGRGGQGARRAQGRDRARPGAWSRRDDRICSTSTLIATVSARCRPGIRRIRSPNSARRRCDHACPVVGCCHRGLRRGDSCACAERAGAAGGRGARHRHCCLHAMPYADASYWYARRARRLETARPQHGDTRRAIVAARHRHRAQLSQHQLRPGQSLPPAKPVTLAPGTGKELVETRCTLCHDLERVTAVKRQKGAWPGIVANMFDRFGLSAPDEAKAIASYLVANYGSE